MDFMAAACFSSGGDTFSVQLGGVLEHLLAVSGE
jgi:hypothetical protein